MAFNETMRRAFRPCTENGLTASERHVLLEVCNRANKAGKLFPAHDTIAKSVGCSRATVVRAMARLEALGWVTKERRRRRDGTRCSDMLRVSAPMVAEAPARLLPLMSVMPGGAADKVAPCNTVKVAPCDIAPRLQSRTMQQQNPIKEINLEPESAGTRFAPVDEEVAAGLMGLAETLRRRSAG